MSFFHRTLRLNHPTWRLARARDQLTRGEYNEARLDTEGLLDPESVALHLQALAALVEINLEEYRYQRRIGDRAEADGALQRARRFGATPEQIESARRTPWRPTA